MQIINYEQLITHGRTEVRRVALDLTETALRAADPGQGTKRLIKRCRNLLSIGEKSYDLDQINNIYVIGIGKASYPIIAALEDIIGDEITAGILLTQSANYKQLEKCEVMVGGHPLPDTGSVRGAEEVIDICNKAGENDLVFTAITGGASSLCWLPPADIQLVDIRLVSDILLKSGMDIGGMNTVRRHLGRLKGGRLLKYIEPAENITLTMDTIPETAGIPWPDLTQVDDSTYGDAITVLKNYNCWADIPQVVRDYLQQGEAGLQAETLKTLDSITTGLFSVASPGQMCEKAADRAEKLGYNSVLLANHLEGESREAGICLAAIAQQIVACGVPFKPPVVLITGGETTVSIGDEAGKGGPNQEFVLGLTSVINSDINLACVAVDTDGIDGNSNFAGGIVDGDTVRRARKQNINLQSLLFKHCSSQVLSELGDGIETGPTGTNLQDFRVIVIGKD